MKDKILNKKVSGWLNINAVDKEKIYDFCDGYIDFLNNGKTEREVSDVIVKLLDSNGFKRISDTDNLKPNDKVYMVNRNKSIYVAVIGSDNITSGINIVGAHIDSPRLDLKRHR